MGPVVVPVQDIEWISVEESSAPGQVRRAVMRLAERMGFSEHRVGEVGIAASELATNLHRHAKQGSVVIRVRRENNDAAVELVVIDAGPGMSDLAAHARDGTSSAGTLGIGLGAAMRLATWFEGHSTPGRGTVMLATFWRGEAPCPRPVVGALTRPMAGESVCGDAYAQRSEGAITSLLLADGLGHGELAAMASRQAVRTFSEDAQGLGPAHTLEALHAALRGTRGAAVAVVRLDLPAQRITFAGVGNIAVWIDDGERRRAIMSSPGIVGNNAQKIREVESVLPRGALVVLHSDGLTSKWDLRAIPGLWAQDPHVVAGSLMREAGIRHDDASVVVARAS